MDNVEVKKLRTTGVLWGNLQVIGGLSHKRPVMWKAFAMLWLHDVLPYQLASCDSRATIMVKYVMEEVAVVERPSWMVARMGSWAAAIGGYRGSADGGSWPAAWRKSRAVVWGTHRAVPRGVSWAVVGRTPRTVTRGTPRTFTKRPVMVMWPALDTVKEFWQVAWYFIVDVRSGGVELADWWL